MRTTAAHVVAVLTVAALAACSSDGSSSATDPAPTTVDSSVPDTTAAATTSVAPTTVEPTTAAPTTVEPTTLPPTTVPPTTAPPETTAPPTTAPTGPFEIVAGLFNGVGLGTKYADAIAAFPALADPPLAVPPAMDTPLCSISAPFSEMRHDGPLTVLFEGDDLATSVITNWYYGRGGAPDDLTLVARAGVTLASSRAMVGAAYPEAGVDEPFSVDFIDVDNFRIGFDGDSVAWFAVIICGD